MELLQQFEENTGQLADLIGSFSEGDFFIKPSEEEWSAAEVLEHLYRSEFGVARLFLGESTRIERRPDTLVQKMEDSLLNFSKKTKAPEVIQPTKNQQNKNELLTSFKSNREKIAQAYSENEPTELCLMYKHPVYGSLTRFEWLSFCILHTKRHIHQLKEIRRKIS
ncbi:MAG: hypothetical protein CL666_12730 [Balneola sp.]|nr:hypothetical protein [Balneola sp.]|tara:strand:+ start:124816 stop:125313 length:498 start_codon:yes stop_codon:yes gene_type:complete